MLIFKLFFGSLYEFLKPTLELFASEGGKILARAALSAVTVVAEHKMGSTNNEQRDAAFELIKAELAAKSIEMTASAINLAIETAVRKKKYNLK